MSRNKKHVNRGGERMIAFILGLIIGGLGMFFWLNLPKKK
jgi:hypothetical protein